MVARLLPAEPWRLLLAAAGVFASALIGLLIGRDPALGVSAVLGLAYVPVVLVNLPLGLALWVVLVFLAGLPSVGLGSTMAGVLVLGAWLGNASVRQATLRYALYRQRWLLTVAVLFLLWLALSVAFAGAANGSGAELVLYLVSFVVFVVVVTTPSEPHHVVLICGGFVLGALLIVLVGAAQGGLAPAPASLDVDDGYGGRLASGGTDPNYIAAGLVPAMALAAALFARQRHPVVRLGLVGAIAMCAIGLAATQSRGGLLAAAVALVVAFVLVKRHRRQVAAVALVTVAAIAGWVALNPAFAERLSDADDGGTGRTELWSVAWQMAGDHPVTGVGLAQFQVRAADYARQTGSLEFGEFLTEQPKVVHNVYLQLLAEQGVIGLLLFLAFVAVAIRATWVAVRRLELAGDESLADLGRAIIVAQAAALTASAFISNGTDRRTWILLALGPALLTVAARRGAPALPGRRRTRRGAGASTLRVRARMPLPVRAPAIAGVGLAAASAPPGAPGAPGATPPGPPLPPTSAALPPGRRRGGLSDAGRVHLDDALVRMPGLLAFALGLALAPAAGGFRATTWYPAALFAIGLLVVAVLVAPLRRGTLGAPFKVALVCLAGFTAWSFLSITWAATPADAWEGANRALFVLAIATLIGLRSWPPILAQATVMVLAAGLATIGVVTLLRFTGPDASDLFLGGRLAEPLGYANGNAALWLIGFWLALHVAIIREAPAPLRGTALGAATILLGLAVLTQSRGGAAGLIVTAIVFVLLHPRRWPALAAFVTVAGLTAVVWGDLIDVRLATTAEDLVARADTAKDGLVAVALVAVVLGTLVPFAMSALFRRGGVPDRARRTGDRIMFGLAALVLVACVGLAVQNRDWVDARWGEFRSASYVGVEDETTRFTGSLGSGRYDYYRVAVDAFRKSPVGGIGADNFAVEYVEHRRLVEAPRYPHSLVFGVLAQLGAIGALLLGGFFAALAWGIARVRRRGGPMAAGVAAAAVAAGLAWAVHGAVDWLWEFPALTALAVGLFVLAARTRTTVRDEDEYAVASASGRIPFGAKAVLAGAAAAAAFSIALPAAAVRMERSGYDIQRSDPDLALQRLLRAADLNPVNADPLVARAVLARRLGQDDISGPALAEAVRREPRNWLIHFEIGLLEAQQGRRARAVAALGRAARLNPLQPVVPEVRREIAAGRTVDPDDAERRLTQQLTRNIQPTDPG